MRKNDGGPAFPITAFREDDDGNPILTDELRGMSLRDWFAGQALTGLLAISDRVSKELQDEDPPTMKDWARDAYRLADAMLAEREKGGA